MKTGIAYVGCGFVADFYHICLANAEDQLELQGVYDIDPDRLHQFASHHGLKRYGSFEELLCDETVSIVLNLTNPHAHYEVSKACLNAGKHVYSEKPLAMDVDQAADLVRIAQAEGLEIAAAPSSMLSGPAQTLWRAVRQGRVGRPRLVYAELDDGMIHRRGFENWRSISGAPWPAKDEFEVGCTVEHAGYAVSWLVAIFGPVRRIRSFSSLLISDKGPSTPPNYTTPDMSVGCLLFDDGVVARVTNSIIAPHDHAIRVFGEEGELRVSELWNFSASVTFRPVLESRVERFVERKTGLQRVRTVPPARRENPKTPPNGANMDFMRGVAEMAEALAKGQRPRLAGEFALHITEVALALQHPETFGPDYIVKSSFKDLSPLDWAL